MLESEGVPHQDCAASRLVWSKGQKQFITESRIRNQTNLNLVSCVEAYQSSQVHHKVLHVRFFLAWELQEIPPAVSGIIGVDADGLPVEGVERPRRALGLIFVEPSELILNPQHRNTGARRKTHSKVTNVTNVHSLLLG